MMSFMHVFNDLNFFFLLAAGATLCKGLNRGLGTLLAGSLAFIVGYIANACSRVIQAVFIGAAVFLIGIV